MSSSSSYSGSSAVYSDSSRASTPEPTVPPPANVTAPAPPQEAPAGEPAPEAVAHVSTEVNGAVLRALNRPAAPRLEALLRMIVWAQKQLVTERDEDRSTAPPYPGAGRFGGASTSASADTNTIARALFGGTSC
ncbi:hypothetical protein Y032_0680g1467 [Ancylostoma ceylanicum]|uniref:Uncharacterized protein n=1 Tax=Ancylostoma ceylanicum TaxID=53326 RepID=A0A016WHD9_9BILA|nr:hypothetical protein Y032_0680g1467 [Ancylostoma ceylanicum]